mgnify:CR=1 FL=1
MSFSADWLALREPADRAARDPALLARAAAAAGAAPLVVDLGCGTGATARAMAGHLPGARWRLVDADADLLARAAAATGGDAHRLDLADLGALPLAGADLVTASALLDLMPAPWVEALADRLAALRLPFYAALSYDGVMEWSPPHPADAAVTRAFNRHQRTDKGLGPALGPDAAATMAAALCRRGMHVTLAPSPWRLGPAEAALQADLLDGIAAAAREAGCAEAAEWRAARGADACVIGHADLLALPAPA